MHAADLPAVLQIQAACYTEVSPESLESLRAKLLACPSACFVASVEGETIGYLIALLWEFSNPPVLNAENCHLPSMPDCLYLHDLAVSPHARKGGAGRELVKTFLGFLRNAGMPRASLIAVQNSKPYWERFGFRVAPISDALKRKISTYGNDVEYMELRA